MAPVNQTRSAAGEHNIWLVAIVVSLATMMEVLDTSIANVSLQHIAGGLAASRDEGTWVLTSYLVSNAVVLPISGWLSRIVGRKRFYMLCVALFGASSLLCGIAPSLGWLIFFRVLQGLGGGGLAPSEQSILADTFPPEKRGQAFALYGVAVVVAPTVGPTLGGWITDSYSWRWIFLINVPVCLLSLSLAGSLLVDPPAVQEERRSARAAKSRLDFLGILFVSLGLGCMQVVLDKGQEDDWFASDLIVVFSIISALSLVFLVVWELEQEDPIVDLPLMRNRSFATSMGMMFVTGFVLISTTQLLPQYLQSMMGYTAMKAGMALTAGGAATLVMMPVAGVLTQKIQPKYLIAFGLTVEALACYHLRGFTGEISFAHAAVARAFQGMGLPFLFVPISTISYQGVPPARTPHASALINTMRNLGGSWGISVTTTLLARREQFHHSRLAEGITQLSPAYQNLEHIASGPGGIAGGTGPLPPTPVPIAPGALGVAAGIVQRQAELLSYVEIFAVLAACCVVAVPLALTLAKVKPGQPAAGH
ncbi:EmrB/QacA family drug resistance transporter [Opitutaceae bacterium EW11]|nr:EmrB/QacA family drug resistance transporter [Opitutaceae bacterium EW11]